jgi:hypothetical protein
MLFLALHCELIVHAAQTLLEQIGVVPLQSVLVRHCTQVLVAVLQKGVGDPHWVSTVHFTQEPPVLQAGADVPLRALHSVFPVVIGLCVQPRQVNEAASQMGVVAVPQLVDTRHATHAPVAVRQ